MAIIANRLNSPRTPRSSSREIEYEELPVVTDMETALAPDAYVIHPDLGDNLCFTREIDTGNLDQVVGESDLVVERTFRFPRHTGVCLEGRSVVGDYDAADRRLTVSYTAPGPEHDPGLLCPASGLQMTMSGSSARTWQIGANQDPRLRRRVGHLRDLDGAGPSRSSSSPTVSNPSSATFIPATTRSR